VISAVTKSGGNVFRGEGPLLLRGQRARGRPGEAAGARSHHRGHRLLRAGPENKNRQSEFGGSIGGPIVKNRLFFYGAYSPRAEKRDNLYNFTDATSTFSNENLAPAGVRKAAPIRKGG
jgi:hypothetical protein